MTKQVLTESQVKERILEIYNEEYINVIERKRSKLDKVDKTIVIEMLRTLQPTHAKLIKEYKLNQRQLEIVIDENI